MIDAQSYSWKHQDRGVEDAMAKDYDYLYNRTNFAKAMYSDFAKLLQSLIKEGKVLELGCGTGTISDLLAENSQLERFCMDFSYNMLKIAKNRCSNCLQADMENLPYGNESFDLVYVHSALHHFPQLDKVLSEARRILKPSGYLVIQEPNEARLRRPLLIRVFLYGLKKLGIEPKQYEDVTHLETKPSEHHGLLAIEGIQRSLRKADLQIARKAYRYYASRIVSSYQSRKLHRLARALDSYYINKYQDGYMFFVIARKP